MKLVLIGDSNAGKSALAARYVQNQMPAVSKATVGVAFFKQTVVDPDSREEYAVQIWDTAGQEKFQSVTTHHYRAADGALIVFDITSESSFRGLDRWLTELYENTDPSVVVMLVGTKADLAQQRVVSEDRARAWARKNGALYFETSALWDKMLAGRGVTTGADAVFMNLVQAIVKQRENEGHNPLRIDISGFSAVQKGLKLGSYDEPKAAACDC
mmetsp:Transcript_7089/g.11434  ORF Transcript_7089/g.11434 Transcript_7089/m.11434 type:complete len:214 (-) Transcript_7089:46-687(-)